MALILQKSVAPRKPRNYWATKDAKLAFVGSLAQALQIKKIEDWYQLRASMIREHPGGNSFLRHFDWSPINMLKEMYPDHEWEEWRFSQVPQKWWADRENCVRFMDSLRRRYSWIQLSDLYNISADILRDEGGASISLLLNRTGPLIRGPF